MNRRGGGDDPVGSRAADEMDHETDYDRFIAPIRARMVNAIWRIVRHPDDVDDVVQDALLAVLERIADVRAHPNPTALVLRICVGRAVDHVRRSARWRRRLGGELPEVADLRGRSVADVAADREDATRVLVALRRLPAREALAVCLRMLEELSHAEIAAGMGISDSTARVLVSRGRQRLRRLLRVPAATNRAAERSSRHGSGGEGR